MPYNKKEVLQRNTEAIRVVLRLEKERRIPTPEEQAVLRGYQGFGGLKCVLNRCDKEEDIQYWAKSEQPLFEPTRQLKALIDAEATDRTSAKKYWDSIKSSVLTSFYTDRRIVAALAEGVASLEVPVRRMLDPSAGMGVFAETFARQAASVDMSEKDLLTARIAAALHPAGQDNVTVHRKPFEALAVAEEDNRYDLVATNIPFGNLIVYDREYLKGSNPAKRESTRAIHNYFFVKALDHVKEGGLVAFITSQGVLDSPSNEGIRTYLMQHSRPVSVLRLPAGMFSDNAGTAVGSDMIVLQKQSGKNVEEGLEQRFV